MKRLKLVKEKQRAVFEKRKQETELKLKRENQVFDNRKDWMKKKIFESEKNRREHLAQKEFEQLKV